MLKKLFAFAILISVVSFGGCLGCRTKEVVDVPKNYDGIELTYYKVFDDSEIIEPFISGFIATHPGLKINYRKFSDFDEYQKTVLNEMAEGEGPDIFTMQNTWFAANIGKLNPMPQSFGTPADFAETFVDVAYRDLVHVDEEGKQQVYAFPMTVDTLALYYNKEHFEDRIPERGRPADTWEGIKDDVVLLTKEGDDVDGFEVSGIAMGRAENITRAVDIFYLLLLQYGVDFYNENISEAIFAGLQGGAGSYPGLNALDFFISFADPDMRYYTWNEFSADRDSPEKEIEAFARGDVSMIIGFSYTYDDILNQIDVLESRRQKTIEKSAIRVAPIPQLEDPDTSSEKRVSYASYFAETVSRNTEYPDLAWEFLLYLASKDNLEQYFDSTHKPTSRRDMISDQKKDPNYGVFAGQIGYAESFPIVDYYIYKELFTDVIIDANDEGALQSGLVHVQDKINEMLPDGGLLNEEVIIEEEE